MNRIAMLATVCLSACVVGGGERTWTFTDPAALRVDLGNGSVVVEPSGDDVLTVDWSGGGVGTAAVPTCEADDDHRVFLDAGGGLGGGDFTVRIPSGVDVDVFVDRGDLDLTVDAPADVTACVGFGSARIEVPAGAWDVDVQGGAGELDIDGIVDDPESPWHLGLCLGAGELEVRGI